AATPDSLAETQASVLARLRDIFNLDRVLAPDAPLPDREQTEALVHGMLDELKLAAGESYRDIERYFLLEELDRCWKEHLRNMDALRDGIGLRGYGQRDPKLEYKREGFEMFQDMLFQIRESVFRALTRVRVQLVSPEEEEARAQAEREAMAREFRHREEPAELSYSGGRETVGEAPARKPVRAAPRVGRNDPCPCGSGKKYKKCCGRGQ
ncbi:MAG: preprotein translocase subunit SecA, partial [Desulfovibrio sp.]|nr:preprotein translocase subunit SecA [Desulfovibrio sp.]